MIYLDYAASNPVDSRVRETMAESLNMTGNPSSIHMAGRMVRKAIDEARTNVANLLDAEPHCVVFTSGATEANNTALFGYFKRLRELFGAERELHLLVSAVEHPSVRAALGRLESEFNIEIDRLSVDADGVVRTEFLPEIVKESTVMVCVMWANNVMGAIQPVEDIAKFIKEQRKNRGEDSLPFVLMSDAVQALRTEEIHPMEAGIDILTLSGHKLYGPKGVGALYVRQGIEIAPLIMGGEHESGLRAGTENVQGIIGLGKAAEILQQERLADREKLVRLSRRLREGIRATKNLTPVGDANKTLPGILYASSAKEEGDILTIKLDAAGIAASSGSACDAGTRKTASILQEIRTGQSARRGGIRLSFGRFTAEADIEQVLSVLKQIL